MKKSIAVILGDGIGPEVTEQAVRVLQAVADGFGHQLQLQQKLIGGAALAELQSVARLQSRQKSPRER